MIDFKSLFSQFSKVKIAVIGDVMLDTYWWGKVDRISPEAPVPIASILKKEYRIGGAGNVALNTEALLAPTTVFSVIGDDDDGKILTDLLKENEIETSYILKDKSRPTTNKIRIMGRSQQMMRIDYETIEPINDSIEEQLIDSFQIYVEKEKPSIAILEDYNKGVLTPKTIESIIDICKKNNVFTAVDPKSKNFFSYKNVDIFKPNLKEVIEALHIPEKEVDLVYMKEIHAQLKEKLTHSTSLITLSERGIFFQNENEAFNQPAFLRNIADVSGAGDTVIAVVSVVYALTKDMKLASSMANIAGGLVCEELGTAVIHPEKLFNECSELLKRG